MAKEDNEELLKLKEELKYHWDIAQLLDKQLSDIKEFKINKHNEHKHLPLLSTLWR